VKRAAEPSCADEIRQEWRRIYTPSRWELGVVHLFKTTGRRRIGELTEADAGTYLRRLMDLDPWTDADRFDDR
jgi:hypothetical protein